MYSPDGTNVNNSRVASLRGYGRCMGVEIGKIVFMDASYSLVQSSDILL